MYFKLFFNFGVNSL